MRNSRGFTLVELLVVVSLMIIVVGVTGDIIISLVRSYSKTQITNEIEQNANFVMTKLEKELRNASNATVVSDKELQFNRRLPGSANYESITYTIKDNLTIVRDVEGVDGGVEVLLINDALISGVEVIFDDSFFTDDTAGGPTVVRINLSFKQAGNPAVQFTQDIDLESTVVVRGSY